MKKCLIPLLLVLLTLFSSCKEKTSKEKTSQKNLVKKRRKIEAWIHFHPPLPRYLKKAMEFGRRAKEAGYTTIVIRACNSRGFDPVATSKLVRYLKYKLNLKVVPEIKLLGKSHITFGKKFVKNHPELFVGNIIDPYAMWKKKTAFDSLIMPLIKKHIEVFENPEYFLLGWDEYNTEDIKKIALRHKKSISEVWAGTLNRVTEYLLSRNITPIIFGDQLLSELLAEPNNPLGYPPDKRFKNYLTVHSRYPKNSTVDLIYFVKDIKNKDKIIIADWHYKAEKEYPSVDYFKWLGFKEIIPVTWGNEVNMKYFSLYAQKRGITRMMASVWHYFFHHSVEHLLWPTLYNSIYYFRHPTTQIPGPSKIEIVKDGKGLVLVKPGESINISISPAGKRETFFYLYPFNVKARRKNKVYLTSKKNAVFWRVPNNAEKGLWVVCGYSLRDDGYLLYDFVESGFYIGDISSEVLKRMIEKKDDDTLIHVNFGKCIRIDKGKEEYVFLGGSSNISFGILKGNIRIKNGSLICEDGGLFIPRSGSSIYSMKSNKTVLIRFSIDKYPEEKQEWSGLLTWGVYGEGFRIILWHKRICVQVFGLNRNNIILKTRKVDLNKRYTVVFNMNSSNAMLYLNGKLEDEINQIPEKTVMSYRWPLCIGCSSYKDRYVVWKPFYGKIYSFSIWDRFIPFDNIKN